MAPWQTPSGPDEERSSFSHRSLALRRSFSDEARPLSPTKLRQRSGSGNAGEVSSSSPEAESEDVTPGTLREELSKLVDGIAGEDGRIRLADFKKLSGCSPAILAALQMKLPRQTSWEASQVKEVLLNEMCPHETPPPSPVSRPEPVPHIVRSPAPVDPDRVVPPERTASAIADGSRQAQTPGRDGPLMGGRSELSPPPSPLRESLAPPPPSPTSLTPSSPLALTPAVARTPVSPASSSPRSRAQTPHELLAAAAAAFQSVVPRLRLERLRRDAPISADFTVSAPVVAQPVSNWPSPKPSDSQGGGREGTQGDTTSRTAASALQVPGGDDSIASAEDLRLLMKRGGSPRHNSAMAPHSPFLGSSTPSGSRLSAIPAEGGTSGSGEPPWHGRARAHTVMVPGRGAGMQALEQLAQAAQPPEVAAPWLAPDLREVAALLRQGEWHRGGGAAADKSSDSHEYVGHGQSARYFERLDNVMEGDSMEQLVKRAKRKAFIYIQNTFKMPDAAPDAEPSDALPSLALPTDGSERRRSNSLWSRLSPARVREAGLEWARKDSFASTMSNAPSVVSATHKGSDREEAAGTVRDDGASVCTAAESAESQTKKEGGGKGDDLSKHHSDSGEGIFLDPARAAQLKTVFLQMADFYLSICYHLGSLFTKEKEKNFEDRQHLQDMLDRYKEKIQVAEQKLMLNFELAQQQREQLDALERDIHARDDMDRRREGLLNELQGRLKKQHEVQVEELRKRDEEAEESLRQYEALRRKYHKLSEDYESLRERFEEAEERIGSLTAAAAKRSGTGRSEESTTEAFPQETKVSLADEMASFLAPPPGSFTRSHTPPGRRNERAAAPRASFHKWSVRKTETASESPGVSLLEEIQQSGSDMQLPQVNEREASSTESEPERPPSPKERDDEVLPPAPAAKEEPVELPDDDVPALPPPPSPESPKQEEPVSRGPSRQLRRVLMLRSLSASDRAEMPPPPKPLPSRIGKTVIKRFGKVARPAFVRRWRELSKRKHPFVLPTRRLSSDNQLNLWEAEVVPEEPPVLVKEPDVANLALVGALGRQALRLQMSRWQKRYERRRKRPVLSLKSLLERLLSSNCLQCSPCTAVERSELHDTTHVADGSVHLSAPLGPRLSAVSVQA